MNRQGKQRAVEQAKAEVELRTTHAELAKLGVEEAKDDLESKKYWADKNEKYLERMRNGYAEGTKLYYDSFKTRATLTTASIVVILGLSRDVLSADPVYGPVLWASVGLLFFSMVAALRTLDGITNNVFDVLTNEHAPTSIRDGTDREEAEHVRKAREDSTQKLSLRTRIASASFLSGIGAFAAYAVLPPLVGLIGLLWGLHGGDHVRLHPAHDVGLEPVALLHPAPVLRVVPAGVSAGREARSVHREVRFYGFQGQAADGHQFLQDGRKARV